MLSVSSSPSSSKRSLLSSIASTIVFVIAAITVQTATTVDAKFLDMILDSFETPSIIDQYATAPGHFAEKTVEFLAFGDAAMDYYQSN